MRPPVVILVGTSHPGNVGAAARGAANFGVEEMRFVAPRCDVKCKEALDRSVHAKHLLENGQVFETLEEALGGLSMSIGTTARKSEAHNHFLRKPRDAREWAEDVPNMDGTIGLVFGREDTGLTREEVNQLDDLVTIPTSDYASLNLAHAVTLLCYEHLRARAESITQPRVLTEDTLGALNRAWDALTKMVDARPWRQEVAMAVWRKMLGRAQPDDHEVHNIMGIITRSLKRFDHPDFRTTASSRFVRESGLLLEGETPIEAQEEE